jgi:hypothetical protein
MVNMDLKQQLEICYRNYKKWKELAFSLSGVESQKAMERAFFWLEMHSAFFAIGTLEKTKKMSKEDVFKLIQLKSKLIERLSEYAKTLIEDF